MAASPAERLIALGEFARPHGIAGEVKVRLYNEATDVFERERVVTLRWKNGDLRPARLVRPRRQGKGLVAHVEGYDGREGAEKLRGVELCLPRAELPDAAEGEFYAADLEGARVELREGQTSARPVGRVVRVVSYPTCDALEVEVLPEIAAELALKPKKRGVPTVEVPLLDAYVEQVDAGAALVVVRTLEGLEG